MIVVRISRHEAKYASETPSTIGTTAWSCCVDSSANTIEAISARDAPANIAVMPTSAPTRGSMPACGSDARAHPAASSQPMPLPNVISGASVPPDVPLPSAIAHDTNFTTTGRAAPARERAGERTLDVVVADAERARREARR